MDLKHKIKCARLKWRTTIKILCNPGVLLRLKGKFYYMLVFLGFQRDHRRNMEVSEIRILRIKMDKWTYLKNKVEMKTIHKIRSWSRTY